MDDLTLTAKLKVLTDKARSVRMNIFLVYVFEDDCWACSVIHPDHREEDIHGDTIEDIVVNLGEFFKQYGDTNNVALIRPKK